jgi:hypothetical protein
MNKHKLISQNGIWALLMGGVLALYISLTTFVRMPYGLWLSFHNLLIVLSLLLAGFVGYRNRGFGFSFRFTLLSIAIFFAVTMFLYIGSYFMTTTFLADKMVWIPFFYHDYNYHGFQLVSDYLKHEDNDRELLKLQVFSFALSSVMYFAAGSLGYGIKAILDRTRRSSGVAQPGG